MGCGLSVRRLSPLLVPVDARLWQWADWAKDHGENVGWPKTSVAWRLAHAHETGISVAHNPPAPIDMPPAIGETEAAVGRLPEQLATVVIVQYFSSDPFEVKARRARLNRSEYSRRLDNARWAVKTLLGV